MSIRVGCGILILTSGFQILTIKVDGFISNYQEKIPNNVDLSNDLSLQRALEHWQPKFKSWWNDMGPDGFQSYDVYLRTAVSVDAAGWASYGKVKMPEYRWGIFLADQVKDKKIHFGDNIGKPVWQQVPGD